MILKCSLGGDLIGNPQFIAWKKGADKLFLGINVGVVANPYLYMMH
jgi:hypothetical protein